MGFTPEMYAERKATSRQRIVESAFKIFSEKTIDAVNMTDVAHAAGIGVATVYRHFGSKTELVLEVSTWVWDRYTHENRQSLDMGEKSAAEAYRFFLDSFIDLYRNHRDILRFNQFFNVYVQREDVTAEQLKPFNTVIDELAERFHECYEKARIDRTLRTDTPEKEMFSTTLHLMLAAATRYAVGLVFMYDDSDPESELVTLEELLLSRFTNR